MEKSPPETFPPSRIGKHLPRRSFPEGAATAPHHPCLPLLEQPPRPPDLKVSPRKLRTSSTQQPKAPPAAVARYHTPHHNAPSKVSSPSRSDPPPDHGQIRPIPLRLNESQAADYIKLGFIAKLVSHKCGQIPLSSFLLEKVAVA